MPYGWEGNRRCGVAMAMLTGNLYGHCLAPCVQSAQNSHCHFTSSKQTVLPQFTYRPTRNVSDMRRRFCSNDAQIYEHYINFVVTDNKLTNKKPQLSLRNPRDVMLPAAACTVCEIFTFELKGDLETGGWGHSKSSKMPPFDSLGMVSYTTSIATMTIYRTV